MNWHAEVRVDIRHTDRQKCVGGEDALGKAKDWLANEMTEDFKRHATTEDVRERMIGMANDHSAYDGHGRGWEGWFLQPRREGQVARTLVHYLLTPCTGNCEYSKEPQ